MGQIITFGPSSIRARRRRPRSLFYDQAVSSNSAEKLLKEALVWLQPSGIEDTAGNVTAWRNGGTGGSAYDLTSIEGTGVEPTIETVNGIKAVRFDGKQIATSASVVIGQPFTIAFAFNILTDNAQTNYICDGLTNLQCSFMRASSNNTFRVAAGSLIATPVTNSFATVYPSVLVFNGASSTYRIGGSSGTLPTLGGSSMQYIVLGGRLISAINQTNGWIAEPLIWNRVLTSEEIDLISQYYTQQWA